MSKLGKPISVRLPTDIEEKVEALRTEEERDKTADAVRVIVRRYFDGGAQAASEHHKKMISYLDQVGDKTSFLRAFEGFAEEWIKNERSLLEKASERPTVHKTRASKGKLKP